MVEHHYPECTIPLLTSLAIFREYHPEYRTAPSIEPPTSSEPHARHPPLQTPDVRFWKLPSESDFTSTEQGYPVEDGPAVEVSASRTRAVSAGGSPFCGKDA